MLKSDNCELATWINKNENKKTFFNLMKLRINIYKEEGNVNWLYNIREVVQLWA